MTEAGVSTWPMGTASLSPAARQPLSEKGSYLFKWLGKAIEECFVTQESDVKRTSGVARLSGLTGRGRLPVAAT